MNNRLKTIKLMLKNIIKNKLTWFVLMWLICIIIVSFFDINILSISFTIPYSLGVCLSYLAWILLFIIIPIMAFVSVITAIIVMCSVAHKNYKYYLQQTEKEKENN